MGKVRYWLEVSKDFEIPGYAGDFCIIKSVMGDSTEGIINWWGLERNGKEVDAEEVGLFDIPRDLTFTKVQC